MTPARMPLALTERDAKRFWSKVRKIEGADACWVWRGSWRGNGYGAFKADETVFDSHVYSWRLANNGMVIPEGKVVMHTCDVRPCVRPDHLVLGTPSDNMMDAREKGRLDFNMGENNFRAVLNPDLVREIRRLKKNHGLGYVAIGRMLGVSKWAARQVIRGKTWKHVE